MRSIGNYSCFIRALNTRLLRVKTNEFLPYKAVSQSQRRIQITNGDVNKNENHYFFKNNRYLAPNISRYNIKIKDFSYFVQIMPLFIVFKKISVFVPKGMGLGTLCFGRKRKSFQISFVRIIIKNSSLCFTHDKTLLDVLPDALRQSRRATWPHLQACFIRA